MSLDWSSGHYFCPLGTYSPLSWHHLCLPLENSSSYSIFVVWMVLILSLALGWTMTQVDQSGCFVVLSTVIILSSWHMTQY